MTIAEGGRPLRQERRLLPVELKAKTLITPHMMSVIVGGQALEGFPVNRPAQWVKIFVPSPEGERMSGRAYTIRRFSERDVTMELHFALHGDGPCSTWAAHAKMGDVIQIAGPRKGFRLDPTVRHLLLCGDETALPAIASIIEELPPAIIADAFIEIPDKTDIQWIPSKADVSINWLSRDGAPAGTSRRLQETVMATPLRDNLTDIWIAAESAAVRVIRRHFHLVRGHDRSRITASGYWKSGIPDFRDPEGDQ